MELTHASFFSGVGGLDLGLERAGWRTVSFSEIDPYASAVLAERWPGVPNLGDIVAVAGVRNERVQRLGGPELSANAAIVVRPSEQPDSGRVPWTDATLWSGGFPCQDLSVAGKRAGFAGERSSLAFAFLDLVEQHRPPAILLENVPGLLSSNGGKDFGRLLAEVGNLGYGWAYRILDAQFFGVPQRRRRVFVVALDAERGFGADSAAAVLSVGTRCNGHSATGDEARTGIALGTGEGVELAGSLTRRYGKGINTTLDDGATVVSPPPDPGGVREADGLAGRLDDRWELANAISASAGHHGHSSPRGDGSDNLVQGGGVMDSDLLPLGLDSHRYRCCGNGVVANVSHWLGIRLAEAVQ